jgi:hypothetical protein
VTFWKMASALILVLTIAWFGSLYFQNRGQRYSCSIMGLTDPPRVTGFSQTFSARSGGDCLFAAQIALEPFILSRASVTAVHHRSGSFEVWQCTVTKSTLVPERGWVACDSRVQHKTAN